VKAARPIALLATLRAQPTRCRHLVLPQEPAVDASRPPGVLVRGPARSPALGHPPHPVEFQNRPLWAPPIPRASKAVHPRPSLAGAGGPAGRWGDRLGSVNAKRPRKPRISAPGRAIARDQPIFEPLARVTPARIGLQCSKPPKTASLCSFRLARVCSCSTSPPEAPRGRSRDNSKAGMAAWTTLSGTGRVLGETWRSSSNSSNS